METLPVHRLNAFNTAHDSDNKIHDDEVAAKFGFTGGLVPGVDVYGYLCQPAVARWGERFFTNAVTDVRLAAPIYDGEDVEITATIDDDGVLTAQAHTTGVQATMTAHLDEDPQPPAIAPWAEPPSSRPPASPESLAAGTVLTGFRTRCSADAAAQYLADLRDTDSPTGGWGVLHPGWILRRANEALDRSVLLPPWIHVGSVTRHFRAPKVGEEITVTSVVTDNFDRKGHLFVRADVHLVGDDGVLCAAIDHTAIYRPRQLLEA